MRLSLLVASWAATALLAASQSTNAFTNPDPSVSFEPEWTLGEWHTITWNTSFSTSNLFFSANDSQSVVDIATSIPKSTNSFAWIVNVNNSGSPSNTPYYNFLLANADNSSEFFFSPQIYIAAPLPPNSVSTTNLPAVTAPPTQNFTVTYTPSYTSTATPTPTSTSDSSSILPLPTSSGLTPGAAAGIAVAAVFLVLALALVAFFLIRKRRRNSTTQEQPCAVGIEVPRDHYVSDKGIVAPTMTGPAELQDQSRGHELPGDTEGAAFELAGREVRN